MAGTQEPIYGPSAIKSVAEEAEKTPYTEINRDGLTWTQKDSTSVETQVFYVFTDSGDVVMAQVIHSNVAYVISLMTQPSLTACSGIRTTSQFNSKIFSKDPSKPHLWCTTSLDNVDFSQDKTGFYADDCAVELSEDGASYTIKSMNDERAIVNLKISRAAPGWHAGTSGKTLYGTDLSDPWGSIRHAFWPRCTAEGTITTKEGPVDLKGQAVFIMCLQGMKPHHAAAQWKFANFQGKDHSAIMMEFTTPPSYGSTVVNVSCIAKDGEIVMANTSGKSAHTGTKQDEEVEWLEPTDVKFEWKGQTKDGKAVEAVVEGPLGDRVDRIDVMAEVPGFVKNIVSAAAGTKPYIYQVRLLSGSSDIRQC